MLEEFRAMVLKNVETERARVSNEVQINEGAIAEAVNR